MQRNGTIGHVKEEKMWQQDKLIHVAQCCDNVWKIFARYHHQKHIIICVNHQGYMLVNFLKKRWE